MPTSSDIMEHAKETKKYIDSLKKASSNDFLNRILLHLADMIGAHQNETQTVYSPSFLKKDDLKSLTVYLNPNEIYTHEITLPENKQTETVRIISLKGRVFFYDSATDMVGLNRHIEIPVYFALLDERKEKKENKKNFFGFDTNPLKSKKEKKESKPNNTNHLELDNQQQRIKNQHSHREITEFDVHELEISPSNDPIIKNKQKFISNITNLLLLYEKTIQKNNPLLLKGKNIEAMAEIGFIFSVYQTFSKNVLQKSEEDIAKILTQKLHAVRRSLAPNVLSDPNRLEWSLKIAFGMFETTLEKLAVNTLKNYDDTLQSESVLSKDALLLIQNKKNLIKDILLLADSKDEQTSQKIEKINPHLEKNGAICEHRYPNPFSIFFKRNPTNTELLITHIISLLEIRKNLEDWAGNIHSQNQKKKPLQLEN